ncbi:hypothetical protein PIB30_010557 [Stylosanthes scabra]|uniref:Uncharacterized protein n=1 Tax=Stylosanthes scabra TaxID=79078 RepID=A0ABU6S5Q2_9FABA|nr:hypothetical protein [Stylosanthes scabra]
MRSFHADKQTPFLLLFKLCLHLFNPKNHTLITGSVPQHPRFAKICRHLRLHQPFLPLPSSDRASDPTFSLVSQIPEGEAKKRIVASSELEKEEGSHRQE